MANQPASKRSAMMIGLLQSGTGIGRGICPPSFSRGLLEACAPARAGEAVVRTGRRAMSAAPRRAAPAAMPPASPTPAAEDTVRVLAARPAPARRPPEEPPTGRPVLVRTRGA